MATQPTTAAYVRCSTAEQNDALQRRAIKAWVKANGLSKLKWYADKGTGTNGNRPAWKKLNHDIGKGAVDTIVCWRLDRLSRSLKDAANLFDCLQKKGVRLVSVTEGVDLDSITGRMVAGILATFAEFEHGVRQQRQAAGIKRARAAGKTWGGSKKGWSKVSKAQAHRIIEMSKNGVGKAAIARAEGLSWPTVHKIVQHGSA